MSGADWSEHDLTAVGRVRPVLRAPHPVLSQPSAAVDPLSPETVQLAADLVATMRAAPGCVGLAAVQVGVAADLFAVDVSGRPKSGIVHGTFVLANARVVQATRNEKAREGCLSVPDLTGDVKRAGRLVVAGLVPGTACCSSTAWRVRTRCTSAGCTCRDSPRSPTGRGRRLKPATVWVQIPPGALRP